MSLLDLKTDLKSLKYGSDRPGGGNSGQPYQQVDINKVDSGFNQFRMTNFDDGLVRGGVVGATNASVVDTFRIGKFLKDFPKGPLFIVKQVGLQLSNPKLETIKFPTGPGVLGTIGRLYNIIQDKAGIGPTRIYNLGINTLSQVPVNAFGVHLNRHGILPVQDENTKYINVVDVNNKNGNNRLVGLIEELQLKRFKNITFPFIETEERVLRGFIQEEGAFTQLVSVDVKGRQNIKIQPGNIIPSLSLKYGGPNSVYGIGSTNIRRGAITYNPSSENIERVKATAKSATDNLTRLDKTENLDKKIYDNATGVSRKDPRLQPLIGEGVGKETGIRDVTAIKYSSTIPSQRAYSELVNTINKIPSGSSNSSIYGLINPDNLQQQNKTNNTLSSDGITTMRQVSSTGFNTAPLPEITYFNGIQTNGKYETVVIKTGGSWNTVSREQRVGSGRKDTINLTPIFDKDGYWGDDVIGTHNIRDFVRFRIQAIDGANPTTGKWMVFRAYLTDLSDSSTATWNEIKYAGRGDKFYIYDGFSRKINISFKVAALSVDEMQFIYQKLNFLMGNTMPDYTENGLMRGPLVRMSVGNWIDGQAGILDNVNFKVPQESPWEIAIDEPEGGPKLLILPHIVEVSLTFTPIGSDTKANNLIAAKSLTTSHIAQNNTGDTTIQYIK
jgi:hypothetical protein